MSDQPTIPSSEEPTTPNTSQESNISSQTVKHTNQENLPIQLSELEPKYLRDIARMLEFCSDEGKAIPDDLRGEIAKIRMIQEDRENFELILKVHQGLSGIITPATPRSLAATEFPPKDKGAIITWSLVGFLSIWAIVGLVGYPITLSFLVQVGSQSNASGLIDKILFASRISRQYMTFIALPGKGLYALSVPLVVQLNYLLAATIGSVFYGLLKIYDYLKNRTFNPNYWSIYIIRFFLGLIAGMIVGNLGSKIFEGNNLIMELGPGIIALLGGYSSEAVRQILDRLCDVLVTVVKGTDTKTDERLTRTDERLAVVNDLLPIIQIAASDPQTPKTVRDKLVELLQKLKK